MLSIFAQEIPGRLDFVDLSRPDPVIVQPLLAAITLFFDNLPPYSIMFISPITEDK